MVKLKNGSEYPLFGVNIVILKLKQLLDADPMLYLDLINKCRNPEYVISDPISEKLQALALLNNGQVHDLIRDIVLSAVGNDNESFALSSPLEESPSNKPKF